MITDAIETTDWPNKLTEPLGPKLSIIRRVLTARQVSLEAWVPRAGTWLYSGRKALLQTL